MPKMLLSDEEISKQIQFDVNWARDFRQPHIEDWNAYYRLYKNYVNKADTDTAANVAIPTAFSLVEVQTAFLIDMVMEGGHFVEVLGRTPQGQASAKAIRDLLDYHFNHSIQTYELLEDYIRQLLIYGTSIMRVDWEFKPGWMARMRPVYDKDTQEFKGWKKKREVEVLKNGPTARVVDNYHFLFDPNGASIEECRFAAEEMWIDPTVLREKEQSGKGWRNIDHVIGGTPTANTGLNERLGEIDLAGWQNAPCVERGKVPIVDYWGYLTKGWQNGELKKDQKTLLYHVVAGFAGGEYRGDGLPIVLFAEETPFFHNKIPFVDARLNAPLGEFYGSGDIEFCESLLEEQRDIRNSLLENVSQTTNRMFKMRKGVGIDPAELTWRPSGIISVNEMDDVDVLNPGQFDPTILRTQDDLRRDIEQVTGINDFVMGQYRSSTGFNDTATGISLIQETAMKRIGHKGQVVQRAIREAAQMVFTLIAQFQPYDQTVRVLDNESATQYRFLDISREALQNQYDFNVVSAPAIGAKPQRQNQMIQLYQLATDAAAKNPNASFDIDRFLKRIIDEMDIPNSNELFGFDQLNKALPPGLAEGMEGAEERIPPDEENRMMIEMNQAVIPNLGDHHPHHMYVHSSVYEDLPEGHPARKLIEQHYGIHVEMSKSTKEMIGQAMGVETMGEGIRNLSMVDGGGGGSSPTGAGGREGAIRGMGNANAGNA